jgi:hypothetical protein
MGLFFYSVDWRDADAEKVAANTVFELARIKGNGDLWYVGHFGFQYYAEQAGMKPTVAGRSHLSKGAWLVVPDERVLQQKIEINAGSTKPIHRLSLSDPLPLRTKLGYYGGRIPLETLQGPRLSLTVYQATADFVPGLHGPLQPADSSR